MTVDFDGELLPYDESGQVSIEDLIKTLDNFKEEMKNTLEMWNRNVQEFERHKDYLKRQVMTIEEKIADIKNFISRVNSFEGR